MNGQSRITITTICKISSAGDGGGNCDGWWTIDSHRKLSGYNWRCTMAAIFSAVVKGVRGKGRDCLFSGPAAGLFWRPQQTITHTPCRRRLCIWLCSSHMFSMLWTWCILFLIHLSTYHKPLKMLTLLWSPLYWPCSLTDWSVLRMLGGLFAVQKSFLSTHYCKWVLQFNWM